MGMNASCMSCKDKYPGCHDGCIKFISQSLAFMEQKEEIRKGRNKEISYCNYKKAHMKKGKKR